MNQSEPLRRVHLVFGENEFAWSFDFDFEYEGIGIINNYYGGMYTVSRVTVEAKVTGDETFVEE